MDSLWGRAVTINQTGTHGKQGTSIMVAQHKHRSKKTFRYAPGSMASDDRNFLLLNVSV